jgi:glycosyltransferase involved in cell wall biosynthesis
MRFHVVGLPFTQTTNDFPACAFTMKVRKFAKMMHAAGHEVFLYSGEHNTTPCTEHIPCITEEQRAEAVGDTHYTMASFDRNLPHWQAFNMTVVEQIKKRAQPKDFICVIGGTSHQPIADALPNMMTVEFGIGYPGTFAKFRVFESYAWMHTIYGTTTNNAATLNGNFYDTVINGYLDESEFYYGAGQGNYFMFIGRLIERKGAHIAAMVAEHLGARLIVAGVGTPPAYGEYIGPVGVERAELFRNATAIFAPTLYIEPYGTVVPEAMMCGTPAITTDFGSFTELVQDGVNGYKCHTLGEFIQAAIDAPQLDRKQIAAAAFDRFSLEKSAVKYEKYFRRLQTLWGDGWYSITQ